MSKLLRIFIPFLLTLVGGLNAQKDYIIDVQHLSVEEGLSHRQINTVFQDSRGFIWVGTRYGLNRFDGHNFKVFSKEKNGLTNNHITQLFEDDEGWLWVMYISENKVRSISFVNIYTLEVSSFNNRFKNDLPFDFSQITYALSNPTGTIYLSSDTGKIFKFQRGEFQSISIKNTTKLILKSFSPSYNLLALDKSDKSELIVLDTLGNKKYSQSVQDIDTEIYFEDHQANLWYYSTEDKFLLKKHSASEFQSYPLKSNFKNIPLSIDFAVGLYDNPYSDTENIWYKDKQNLFVFTPDKGLLINIHEQYPDIPEKRITQINFDRLGNTWLCTDFGLYKIHLTANPFKNYLNKRLPNYNINSSVSCRGLLVNNGHLWVNTTEPKNFLINFADGNHSKIPVLNEDNNAGFPTLPIFRPLTSASQNRVLTFSNKHLYEFQNQTFQRRYHWKANAEEKMAWSIFEDSNNDIWFGLLELGIGKLEGDSLVNFEDYNQFTELGKSSVYHFLTWDDKHVLISSTTGIYVLHLDKGIIQRFCTSNESSKAIPHNTIHHIHKDKNSENVIWVSTGGGGLLKLEIDENWNIRQQEQYTILDGLSNNVIYAAYEDEYANLWLSSDYGLIQFNKLNQSAKGYTTLDGLPFNEFNRISHYQDANGQIFFGTMNGVTSFYPKELLKIDRNNNKPLRITEFKQFNGKNNILEDRVTDLLNSKQITLASHDKFFNLKFALLEYKDASQIKYSYQLKGQSDEWIYLNENELRLSGLPYGSFTLNIRAQGVSGQFSSSQLAIPITVLKPFYLRNWFFFLSGFGFLFSVFCLYKYRTGALKRRQKELEQQVSERTATIAAQTEELRSLDTMKSRFFANISHELRTPLTLMLAPIDATLKEKNLSDQAISNLLIAKRNGKRLHKMVDEILDLTKLESGKLEVQYSTVNWYSLLKLILSNFESLAYSKSIELVFHYDEENDLQVTVDKEKVEMILVNILANAIKFTPKGGKITLKTIRQEKNLQCQIIDTGRGIHAEDLPHIFNRFYQSKHKKAVAEGGTGIGLALASELVKLLGGKIEAESELNKGSIFTLSIPKKVSKVPDEEDMQKAEIGFNGIEKAWAADSEMAPTNPILHSESQTILLVEDNLDLRNFIKSILQIKYHVITAGNGKEALELLEAQPEKTKPELIISDVMMPVMDGFQLIEALKAHKNYQNIPLIMLTARIEMKDKLKALRIGVDDYLTKPFVEEELLTRIENLLKNASSRISAFTKNPKAKKPPKTNGKTHQPKVNPTVIDKEWLEKLEKIILNRLENVNLVVDDIATEMNLSRRQFYRRIKENTGLTANQYLKTLRLTQARTFLENKKYDSIKAVAYAVGFKDVVYFSRQFKKEFGKLPSEYDVEG